ncbi:MAG: DNA translocase FtsK [Planctomycetota bacterium]|nr:DNA translocase FtsK [Planctomycetota bacterium]
MDTGRDQFKPGPRRGAAGGLGGFEVLGAVVFLTGCLPAAALAKAAARGTDLGAEGLGGAAQLASSIAGWVGLWPGIAIGAVLAIVGAVMVGGGARRDPLRTIAGVVVSGMCVSALASAVSLGAGGLVGDASGGAIAQRVGGWAGLLAGGAVLLFSLWLSFAPERDRNVFGGSPVRRRNPIVEACSAIIERLTMRSAVPTADEEAVGSRGRRVRKIQAKRRRRKEPATLGDALASGSTEGVSHDEAAALAPDDSTLAYMEDVWRRASASYSQADPVPPSPYPADVRLRGEIPAGAAPFDPSATEESAAGEQVAGAETAEPAPSILPAEEVPAPRPAAEVQFDLPGLEVAPFDFADELSAPVPLTEGPASPGAGDPPGVAGPPVEPGDEASAAFGAAPTAPAQRGLPEGVSPLADTPAGTPEAPEPEQAVESASTEAMSPPAPSWERAVDDPSAPGVELPEPEPVDPADIAEVDASGHWARRDDLEEPATEPALADAGEDELVELDLEDDLEPSAALAPAAAEPEAASAPAVLFEFELADATPGADPEAAHEQGVEDELEAELITVEEALEETPEEDEVAAGSLFEGTATEEGAEAAELEEYEYFDEDGRPVSPEDLAEMEVVEEEDSAGDVEESELAEDEEYEYFDEDGNPVSPEDLAEMEIVEEEDSADEIEESEPEGAEEAELEEAEDGDHVDSDDVEDEWEVFEEDEDEDEAEASARAEEEGDEPEDRADDEIWEESGEWEEWDDDEAASAEEDAPGAADADEATPADSDEAAAVEPTKVLEPQAPPAGAESGRVLEAGRLVLGEGRVAVSLLQREMDLAFDEACGILDELQSHGLIGPYKGGKARDILLSADEWEALFTPSAPR